MNISHYKVEVITITVTILYKEINTKQYILLLYRHTKAEFILIILK